VVELDQLPVAVERYPYRVKAQLGRAWPVGTSLCEPLASHSPDLRALGVPYRGEGSDPRGAAHPCLDLADHQGARVGRYEVELTVPGAKVAGDHRVAVSLEVAAGECLSERPEALSVV